VRPIPLDDFPALNASLNGTSALLLLTGYVLIKRRRIKAHAAAMIAAVCTSAAFLACYLIYHLQRPPKSLGLPRSAFSTTYYAILFTHTVLAVVILPLIALTLWRAYKRRWDLHRRISVITFPLWLYVSVTGVIIYWMLYHVASKMR
jgi:uncharacterized membrane protein YozB (DUF420 family)